MERKIIKKEHGITLIALVVTIVVLLILASVTISTVFSDNGILKKAEEARNKTEAAIKQEQEELNQLYNELASAMNSVPEEPVEPEPEMPEGWDKEKVNVVESADGVTVPVPKGYTASSVDTENKVSEGFVIYENTNGEDKEEAVNDSNKDTARTTRNQFVWVPVEEPSEMYGTDSNGKKWGKLYEFSAEGITPLNWTEQDGVMTISRLSYCEPDVVRVDSSDILTISQLESEFNSMIESVERYGGFYIGRYETGNLSQAEAAVIKNNTDIVNQTWYTMYNKSKGIAANGNVKTTMIWGCQWDATMRWMYNQGGEKKTYTYDSTGKGNYSGTNGNKPIATGSNESYAVNNIYDMAGNVYDWTIEAYDSKAIFGRVTRGGYYGNNGSSSPASVRSSGYSPAYSGHVHWFPYSFIYVALSPRVTE